MRREHLFPLRPLRSFASRRVAQHRAWMPLSPRRRRRAPRGWAKDLDLQDYLGVPERRAPRRRPPSPPIRVTDDWPELVPITKTELRVIEGHLREELDALFGPLP